MQNRLIALSVSILWLGGLSCIKQVDVPRRSAKPVLVAEGNITNDSTAYTVRLSYSGDVIYADSIPDQYLEKNAKVTITDDQQKSTALIYTHQGIYTTTDSAFIGQPGRSYTVNIALSDGRKFVSTPEKMPTPVSIDSITVLYNARFDFNFPSTLDVYVNTHDPASEQNYYRWTFESWVGRETHGVGCGFGCLIDQYCYQHFVDNEVNILSDANINGNEIKKQKVGSCYIYTYFNPYVDIRQLSLTREAYQFWEAYQAQQVRTGGILDPLPATIRGNIHNAADVNDVALGYFSAAAVHRRKVILVPYSITPYLLQISAQQFIPSGSIACFDAFPNTISYQPPPAQQYPPPPGWGNAEQIKVYW